MNMQIEPNNQIAHFVQKAFQSEIEKIVKEEAANAEKRVGERVRSEAGAIAARVLSRFDMQMRGPSLIITVDTERFNTPQRTP